MGRSPDVLVVEDDDDVRLLLVEALSTIARVVSCRDAYTALARLSEERFDALVTDLLMPGANGLDLLMRMRAMGIRLPVIVTTGFPQLGARSDLAALGVVDVLVKPFDIDRVVQVVEAVTRTEVPA